MTETCMPSTYTLKTLPKKKTQSKYLFLHLWVYRMLWSQAQLLYCCSEFSLREFMLRLVMFVSAVSIMKPVWCSFHSIYWESRASTCFEHYLLILRGRCTMALGILRAYNVSWLCHTVKLQLWYSQLMLYACSIPSAICEAPSEDEQVLLETCRGPWFLINWMKSASHWFHYTDILWCTVSRTLSLWVLFRCCIITAYKVCVCCIMSACK
jgi:hypothetical protein